MAAYAAKEHLTAASADRLITVREALDNKPTQRTRRRFLFGRNYLRMDWALMSWNTLFLQLYPAYLEWYLP